MPRIPLALAVLGTAGAALGTAAASERLMSVTTPGRGELTICRNWLLYRACKPYDKVALPKQVTVGDRITLTYGSNPKDYTFRVVEIRAKDHACVLLSDASHGREDRERVEVSPCKPAE